MGQIVKLPRIADPETLRRTLRETNTPELLLLLHSDAPMHIAAFGFTIREAKKH